MSTPTSPKRDVVILIASDGASHTFNARELRRFSPSLARSYMQNLSDTTIENTKTLEAFAALVSYGTLDTHHSAGELFALLAFLQRWATPLVPVFVRQVVHAVWRRDHAIHPQLAFALVADAGDKDAAREIVGLVPLELGMGEDDDGERREYWDGVDARFKLAAERACESVEGLTSVDERLEFMPRAFDRFFGVNCAYYVLPVPPLKLMSRIPSKASPAAYAIAYEKVFMSTAQIAKGQMEVIWGRIREGLRVIDSWVRV